MHHGGSLTTGLVSAPPESWGLALTFLGILTLPVNIRGRAPPRKRQMVSNDNVLHNMFNIY